ncbi:MAG: bifunctional metallophosphatase/5'-nucleotidase, partial [Erysipelotrichaceae bacterium]|nr:bifunctional metallophosphatase/5'-nucleotidase [Erysipelotrichaceae bacterium]
PYHIIEIDGMKVLFIGILTEEVMRSAANEKVVGSVIDIMDASKEIEKICNAFNGVDIDFTVLLTHIGFENDKKLAAMLDPELGVDVIIGGHSHTYLDEPCKVNDILIVQAGTGTDQIGRFDIIVDTDTNAVESYEWHSIPINSSNCPDDPKMLELVTELKNNTDMKYGRTLRRLNCELHHEDRYKQTSLGNFFADIFAEATACDLVLLTSGSIRVNKLGPIITLNDIMEAFPYDNVFREVKVTGKQLKKIIRYICREEVWTGDFHEFYQISDNWYIIYNRSTKQLETIQFNGNELEDDQMIRFGMTDYDFQNFEDFFGLSLEEVKENGKPRVVTTSCKETLYEYLETSEKIPAYPAGDRLIIKNE